MLIKTILLHLFLSLTAYSFSPVHDLQVAVFTIYQEADTKLLAIHFEKEDIDALYADNLAINEEILRQYIYDRLEIVIDNQTVLLEAVDYYYDQKHYNASFKLLNTPTTMHRITIKNTCLIHIEDHANIIEIRLDDKERDFLMNSDRQELQIDL